MEEREYFTKKEILERLKWLILITFCLNALITIGLILLLVYYNGTFLLSVLVGIFIGFVGTQIYKKYKKKKSVQ